MPKSYGPFIYPSLPASYDFGVLRVAGAGMGNCLYAYFHAVVRAQEAGGRMIAPTWSSLKIGPMLRRELTLRQYGKMFRPHPDEIHGFEKTSLLLRYWRSSKRITIKAGQDGDAAPSGMTIVEAAYQFTFVRLHVHRDMIRRRLIEITISPPALPILWGKRDYVAVHIRLGDFRAPQVDRLKSGRIEGMRLPFTWYVNVIQRLRTVFPELPVYVFSDGREHELTEVLSIDGVSLRREPNDVDDLLALSQARVLVGSNSTFSRWAAFLGDMPSIWLKAEKLPEKSSGEATPICYVSEDDVHLITREALAHHEVTCA